MTWNQATAAYNTVDSIFETLNKKLLIKSNFDFPKTLQHTNRNAGIKEEEYLSKFKSENLEHNVSIASYIYQTKEINNALWSQGKIRAKCLYLKHNYASQDGQGCKHHIVCRGYYSSVESIKSLQ